MHPHCIVNTWRVRLMIRFLKQSKHVVVYYALRPALNDCVLGRAHTLRICSFTRKHFCATEPWLNRDRRSSDCHTRRLVLVNLIIFFITAAWLLSHLIAYQRVNSWIFTASRFAWRLPGGNNVGVRWSGTLSRIYTYQPVIALSTYRPIGGQYDRIGDSP